MRNFKLFGVLAAVLALSAIAAANASAAEFTFSATGALTGKALANQVFTTNGGTITCTKVAISGTIEKTANTDLDVEQSFSGCTAFGFATVDITLQWPVKITGFFKKVHFRSPFKITPTLFGVSVCTVTFGEQEVGTVDLSNATASTVKVDPTVTGIKYTSSGGICGSSGENGTYTGAIEISRVGGGSIQYDK
jgi:hypothetical protein